MWQPVSGKCKESTCGQFRPLQPSGYCFSCSSRKGYKGKVAPGQVFTAATFERRRKAHRFYKELCEAWAEDNAEKEESACVSLCEVLEQVLGLKEEGYGQVG